jgi:hypothetical protein
MVKAWIDRQLENVSELDSNRSIGVGILTSIPSMSRWLRFSLKAKNAQSLRLDLTATNATMHEAFDRNLFNCLQIYHHVKQCWRGFEAITSDGNP